MRRLGHAGAIRRDMLAQTRETLLIQRLRKTVRTPRFFRERGRRGNISHLHLNFAQVARGILRALHRQGWLRIRQRTQLSRYELTGALWKGLHYSGRRPAASRNDLRGYAGIAWQRRQRFVIGIVFPIAVTHIRRIIVPLILHICLDSIRVALIPAWNELLIL